MSVTEKPVLVPGVWGPYYSAMVPKLWLNEAGQSATGKLIDHIIETHPATSAILSRLDNKMLVLKGLNLNDNTSGEKIVSYEKSFTF